MSSKSSHLPLSSIPYDDDDDFQLPLSQTPATLALSSVPKKSSARTPLAPSGNSHRLSKKPRRSTNLGKENAALEPVLRNEGRKFEISEEPTCSLDLIPSSIDCSGYGAQVSGNYQEQTADKETICEIRNVEENGGYLCNSIEARLMQKWNTDCGASKAESELDSDVGAGDLGDSSELDVLIRLCGDDGDDDDEEAGQEVRFNDGVLDEEEEECCIECPLCGSDISGMSEEARLVHTNDCLDKGENQMEQVLFERREATQVQPEVVDGPGRSPQHGVDVSPVLQWLRSLGLERYEEPFVREEIDWDSLKWLSEEDLISIGVSALGPRKKIMHALTAIREALDRGDKQETTDGVGELRNNNAEDSKVGTSKVNHIETNKSISNKLITDYFLGSANTKRKSCTSSTKQQGRGEGQSDCAPKCLGKKQIRRGRFRDIPSWCSVPGTPFRVDAFKYLRGDCSHWFLTHFHMDHYQGLTKSFCHGKVYCSLITAKLVNMKIGIPWERLEVLPLNQKIQINGVDVTCLDANHCPGSVIILFEPPNGKAVLHTGDFRFCDKMASIDLLQACHIHTLILDTTYCNPQYDFPKQEAVIQFVIEAIQAETFNPKTLFLIGSYTIGKERLFLEVARVLRKKVYVTAAKLRILNCLGFSKEDMQYFTPNERESQIHVVPMWTLASFKRLKHVANQYANRFSLIVAFSPTGWSFGKGKKKSPGRRWQQGTIIRYEVPYSEHSSYTELREFVKVVTPQMIIPSVNNGGPEAAASMVSLLRP
ncbi:unnamed protein product [Linum trigynum]|uniref:SAM domain-containing protein n=1 Tax=Linum trigynum TaxID=586398 RepID=A0AAV2EXF6_9ROSI